MSLKDELRRKNLRFLAGMILFALLLALIVILWKLSIYQPA
jgi:predicted nucleic acid-binding Zn ribbon protein